MLWNQIHIPFHTRAPNHDMPEASVKHRIMRSVPKTKAGSAHGSAALKVLRGITAPNSCCATCLWEGTGHPAICMKPASPQGCNQRRCSSAAGLSFWHWLCQSAEQICGFSKNVCLSPTHVSSAVPLFSCMIHSSRHQAITSSPLRWLCLNSK